MLNAIIKQGSASKDVGPAEERGLRARCIDLPPVPPPRAPPRQTLRAPSPPNAQRPPDSPAERNHTPI